MSGPQRDMPELQAGEIVPGQRIGSFQLGMSWTELRSTLVGAYAVRQRPGHVEVQTATLWFLVEERSMEVIRITALGRFRGRLAEEIGIGSTLSDVTRVLGPWTQGEGESLIVEGCPGVSFELGLLPGRDREWQRRHASIQAISVFRGGEG